MTSLITLLYRIQRLILKSCRFTSIHSTSVALTVSTLLLTSGQYAMAGLADQDRRSGYSFPPGNVAPCPGPSCSHHYSNPTLTNHIREMEQRQRQQIIDAQRRQEQLSKDMMAHSQAQMNENLNRIAEQNRVRDQQIDRTIRMAAAAAVYPLWESSPSEVMGIYTMKGWNDKGPIVMTGKGGNFKVPVVERPVVRGGGGKVLLHYLRPSMVSSDLPEFVRLKDRRQKVTIFNIYPEITRIKRSKS